MRLRPATKRALGLTGLAAFATWLALAYAGEAFTFACFENLGRRAHVIDVFRQLNLDSVLQAGLLTLGPVAVWLSSLPACWSPQMTERRWIRYSLWGPLPFAYTAMFIIGWAHLSPVSCGAFAQILLIVGPLYIAQALLVATVIIASIACTLLWARGRASRDTP